MDVPDDLTPAERRLLEALRAGVPCDLLDNSRDPTNDEIAKWDDPTRIVRAKVLRAVLLDQYPQTRPDSVALRGAIIDGDLKLTGDLRPSVRLQSCRIGNARFDKASFTHAAWFDGATFTGPPRFERATFTGNASFDGATFTGLASFREATFTGAAWFDGLPRQGLLVSPGQLSRKGLGSPRRRAGGLR